MLNLTIFLTLAAGLLIFLKWYVRKEIFDPLFLVSTYWILFILISIFISISLGLRFYWIGIIPLVFLIIAFNSGSIVMKYLMNEVGNIGSEAYKDIPKKIFLSNERIKWIVIFFSGMGILAIYLQLDYLDIKIRSLSDLFLTATTISKIRYSGGVDMPNYSLLLMSFLYSSAFFGGISFVITRNLINRIISFLPFVVIIIFTITNGVKAGFLFLAIIWASGYVSACIFDRNGQVKKVKNLIVKVSIVMAFVYCMVPLTQFFRAGKSNEKITFISPGIISYFVSFNAFTIWYHSYNKDELTCFKYTLSGVHNYFFSEREQGLYGANIVDVGRYNELPITTNVYTMARGMIGDFTIFGAVFIIFLTGMLVQWLYLLTKRKKIISMCLLALFFSILFCSFTQNIINYNTIFLSWIISFSASFIIGKKKVLEQHQTSED